MPKFEFTDDEIRAACTELGLPQDSFDDKVSERRKIIDYWGNANIVACPGSGKTTVLLVKLLLLSKRIPFEDGSGICVLTHTNVAIEEIRHRLGNKADILFEHPNFFGTIQNFANKYLAMPYYKGLNFSKSIAFDERKYISAIDNNLKFCLKGGNPETFNVVKHWTSANKVKRYGYRLNHIKDNEIEIRESINGKPLTICKLKPKNLKKDYIDYSAQDKQLALQYLKAVKFKIMKSGIFHYDDAYYLASRAIETHSLPKLLTNRFPLIFIDEAQDTQAHQMQLLDSAFKKTSSKIFFGDLDQAIFNGLSGEKTAWDAERKGFKKLLISDSKRFGPLIAECINPFKREKFEIKGDEENSALKPSILLYNTPSEAVDLFIDQIKTHRLDIPSWSKQAAKFNLVGYIGKEDASKPEKSIISSYAPNYSKSNQQPKFHFDNLVSYFQKRPSSEIDSKGTRIYYELFSNALTETLNIAQGSNHSRATLFSQFKDQNPEFLVQFRQASFIWIKGIEQEGLFPNTAKLEFLNFLSKSGYTIPRHNSFITDNVIKPVDELRQDSNIIVKDGIEIKAGTIHSVKGETHMATMLVETENHGVGESDYFWNKNDDGTKLFCGNTYERPKSYKLLEKVMKTTYVAMSRPTHLLCVAVPKAKAGCPTCPPDKKAKFNWNIIES